jgi:hypothetical protein
MFHVAFLKLSMSWLVFALQSPSAVTATSQGCALVPSAWDFLESGIVGFQGHVSLELNVDIIQTHGQILVCWFR